MKEYVYWNGIDDVISIFVTKQWKKDQYRFHKDQLWSVVALSDSKWKVVETYRYDARWNLILGWQKNSLNKNDNPSVKNSYQNVKESKSYLTNTMLYTSREYDEELDLYYYRARYYDSKVWKFINRDPIGYADNMNLYSYVSNNPVGFVDPWGLKSKSILWSV